MNEYSKDKFDDKEKQIEQLKKQYSKLIKKNKLKMQLILGTIIVTLLFSITNIQKYLILNVGVSSIFIMPAELLFFVTTIGLSINCLNKLYQKKEEKLYQKISDLETSKVNDNQIKKSKELENSYLNNNSIKADYLENEDISLGSSDTFENAIYKNQKEKPKVLVKRY